MTYRKANYANFVSFFWPTYIISNDQIFFYFSFFYPKNLARLISF